jgi:hypothetical protein
MVMAKLHIICGNCGCNDNFSFNIDFQEHDIITTNKAEFKSSIFMICNNCSTIHDLSDNAKMEKET